MAYRILKYYEDALMMVEDVLGAGSTNNIQITKYVNTYLVMTILEHIAVIKCRRV